MRAKELSIQADLAQLKPLAVERSSFTRRLAC
jgi:hypothetical protein